MSTKVRHRVRTVKEKTGSCHSCKAQFTAGEVRFGTSQCMGFSMWGSMMWMHPTCVPKHYVEALKGHYVNVMGWDKLDEAEQEELRESFSRVLDGTAKPGKVKKAAKRKLAGKNGKAAGKKQKKAAKGPKKALSTYLFFCQANRERVKLENPDLTMPERSKVLGAEWKALSEGEKQPYVDQAAADKERYEEELAAFKKDHPEDYAELLAGKGRKGKDKKAGKDLNAPKRPQTGYVSFCGENRERIRKEHGGGVPEQSKLLGAEWKALDPEKKAVYMERARAAKEIYEKQKKQYAATGKFTATGEDEVTAKAEPAVADAQDTPMAAAAADVKQESGAVVESGAAGEEEGEEEEERSVTPALEPVASEVAEEDEGLDVEPGSQ